MRTPFQVLIPLLCIAVTAHAAVRPAASSRLDAIIDEHLEARELDPAPVADDETFLRRVYLDISGTIPTAEQARAFLRSTDPERRARLVRDLLQTPGASGHLYNYWASLLRVQTRIRGLQAGAYENWLKQAFAENRPYNEIVFDLLTAKGDSHKNPAVGYYARDRDMRFDTVSATAQVFLGTQIGCAQCHDHKFDKWTQQDFYEFASYMHQATAKTDQQKRREITRTLQKTDDPAERRRLNRERNELPVKVYDNPSKRLRLPDDYVYDKDLAGKPVQPEVLFGKAKKPHGDTTLRECFAEWLTSPQNDLFTTVVANRLWKRAFGFGVVEPVDDFNDYTTPRNEALLAALTEEMKRVDYDLRAYLEIIFNTQAYQRQTTGEDFVFRSYDFQALPLRRMTAEQVWDSFQTLSRGAQDHLEPLDHIKLSDHMMQMAGSEMNRDEVRRTMARSGMANQRRLAADLPQPSRFGHMLDQFGQSDRETVSEGSRDPSIPQVLFMMNSGEMERQVRNARSPLGRGLGRAKTARERIDLVYMTILTRSPSEAERTRAQAHLDSVRDVNEGYQDLAWALLNSREFLFIR